MRRSTTASRILASIAWNCGLPRTTCVPCDWPSAWGSLIEAASDKSTLMTSTVMRSGVYGLHINEWRTGPGAKPAPIPPCYGLAPVLAVRDVGTTAQWYRNQLDFVIDWLVDDPPTHGSVALCQWTPEGAHISSRNQAKQLACRQGYPCTCLSARTSTNGMPRCLTHGVEIVRALDSFPWGMREFSVRDPNGYILRFGTPA